jgi:predicted  nucleic acid-binding Zn-ribbon protein
LESIKVEKRELLRLLTRHQIDQETYQEQYQFINEEYNQLDQRKAEVEQLLSKEKDTETSLHAFQKEVQHMKCQVFTQQSLVSNDFQDECSLK